MPQNSFLPLAVSLNQFVTDIYIHRRKVFDFFSKVLRAISQIMLMRQYLIAFTGIGIILNKQPDTLTNYYSSRLM